MKQLINLFIFTMLIQASAIAQNGPGGIGNTAGTSNLKLWLKADAGTNTATAGQGVNFWTDQSGAGNNVSNSSAANEPTYQINGSNGMPYLDFDGTNDFLEMLSTSADFSPKESSIFIVGEGSWNGSAISIAQTGINQEMLVTNRIVYHHSSSGNFKYQDHQCTNAIPNTEASILTGIYGETPTDIQLYSNGLASNQTLGSASGPSNYNVVNRRVRIGRRSNGEYFNSKIYEVVVYNRKLTASEQDSVERYLRCKYDVMNNSCGILDTTTCDTTPIVVVAPNGCNTNGVVKGSLKLWLKADAGTNTTTAGQGVNSWMDQSGAGNTVSNNSATNEPTYQTNGANGMPYLEFDGSSDFLEMMSASADFSPKESSIFIVGEGSWNGSAISIAQTGINQEMLVTNRRIYHHSSSGNFKYQDHQCTNAIPNTEASILTGIYGETPTDIQLYSNGLASNQTLGSASGPSNYNVVNRRVRIGRRSNGEYFNSKIYEVLVYNEKLTAVEKDSIECYLRCKYQIMNNGCGTLDTIGCNDTVVVSSNNLIVEETVNPNLSLFPNPTTTTLNVVIEHTSLEAIQIVSLTGAVLNTYFVRGNTHQLDVSELPAGIYFVQAIDENNKRFNKKFIKE